jgi:diguanylate cyclase (GGDEF)-like protein
MTLPKLNPTFRIAIGLAALTTTIIFLASFFGLVPNPTAEKMKSRRRLCESVATTFATRANQMDVNRVQNLLKVAAERNPDVLSMGIRRADETRFVEWGEHFDNWSLDETSESTAKEIFISVLDGEEIWGRVEFRFAPLQRPGLIGVLCHPEILLAAFTGLCGLLVFYLYLRSVLQQLNPSKVIPSRVRMAFDALAEGVLVLDAKERIVLANKAFQEATNLSMESLMGRKASRLPFASKDSTDAKYDTVPWLVAINSNESVRGVVMEFQGSEEKPVFSVGCAPILDGGGANRGALASFENVTRIESQRAELEVLVSNLTDATEEITKQNHELERLATIDPLTNCLNRRSFLDRFEAFWNAAGQHNKPLSAIMVDIDHFKSVNDNHGHAVGDEVLRRIANVLLKKTREQDAVCRFGGEEFAILLPDTDIEHAGYMAEKIRTAIAQQKFDDLSVTASLGVSALSQKPASPHVLLEQADKCLYVAKRNGRDQVVRWDNVPDDIEVSESENSRVAPEESTCEISFHAVTALISSLAFRDQQTANHCRQVADLCVATGEDLLPLTACYTLEIAGLLHDVGKIGLPDSILLKTNELTQDEQKVVRQHDEFGAEMVRTFFGCPELCEIIENFRIPFGEIEKSEQDVSVSARILAIVDAYVSMTSDAPFGQALTPTEAIAELTRCAGDQFDPDLVKKISDTLKSKSGALPANHDRVPKEAALKFGLQIERLSQALDKLDTNKIGAIATKLVGAAEKHGASQIADKAKLISKLNDEKTKDDENYDLIMSTIELLDLCRASQAALVHTNVVESSSG